MTVGNLEFINSFTSGSVTSFSIDNIFSDDYDVYYITGNTGSSNFTNDGIALRLLDNTGTIITATEYDKARLLMISNAAFQEVRATASDYLYSGIMYMKGDSSGGGGFGLYIYNPYDSSSYTFALSQNTFQTTAGLGSNKFIGVHKVAETIRGINLSSTETMNAVEVSVYGVK